MAPISTSYDVQSGFDTTLRNTISAAQTSGIIINEVPTITLGVFCFDPDTTREEWIGFGGRTDNGDGTATLTDVTRGLNLTGDTFTGSSSRAFTHSGGACKVVLVDYHSLFNLKADTDRPNTFTDDQTIGTGKKLLFGDSTVSVRRDANDLKLKDGNQAEVTLSTLAAGAGVNDKAKVSLNDTTASYLNTKVTVSTGVSKNITSPGGDERLEIGLDTATNSAATAMVGNNLANANTLNSSGTAGVTITDKQALSYGGDQRLVLADGNDAALDPEWLFAGIAKAGAATNATLPYTLPGPVATVTPFTLTQRANCRLWSSAVLNTTQNTATDVQDASTKVRAQTFTTSSLSGEDNIGAVTLYLTKTGAPTGSATLKITPVSGGLPVPVLDISQTSGATADAISAAATWRAQTFTATFTGITSISLNLTKSGSPTGSCTVYIKELSGGNPTGSTLGTATVAYSAISGGAADYTFTFSSSVAVTYGQQYAIVFDPGAGVSVGNTISPNYNAASVYAGGSRWTSVNSGGTFTDAPTTEMRFGITATTLGTATLAYSSISTGANTFTFTVPAAISPSTQYALVLEPGSGVSGAAYIAWNYQSTDVYAGGQSCTSADTGSTWTAESTYDRYFSYKFRGIAGEPVYLSDTAGSLELAPGTYVNQIGYALNTTQVVLTPKAKTIYATYSYTDNAAGETVDTEITLGFRPKFARMIALFGSTTNGNSDGFWMNGGGSVYRALNLHSGMGAISQMENVAATGAIGYVRQYNATTSMTTTYTVQSTSANSITIRRVTNAHTAGGFSVTVVLLIND